MSPCALVRDVGLFRCFLKKGEMQSILQDFHAKGTKSEESAIEAVWCAYGVVVASFAGCGGGMGSASPPLESVVAVLLLKSRDISACTATGTCCEAGAESLSVPV